MHTVIKSCLTIGLAVVAATSALADQLERKTMRFGGVTREYFVHKPDTVPAGKTLPVVLALHGGGGNGKGMRDSYGFKRNVEAGHLIAVYPTAIKASWAVGGLPTANPNVRPDHDDVGFLDAVMDEVIGAEAIDRSRMFVTGASRGGFMTQYYLPRTKHPYRAAGTVITSMSRHIADSFELSVPIDFAMIIGDKDNFMPWEGKEWIKGEPRFDLLPVEEAIQVVVRANGLDGTPTTVSSLGNRNKRDGCTNELRVWSTPEEDVRVALVKVIGGGHVVPGRWQCKDFNHAAAMLTFFNDAKPRAVSAAASVPARPVGDAAGNGERFFGQEAFTIVSRQTGTETGSVTEHVRAWGRQRAEIYATKVKLGALTIDKDQRILHDGGDVTTIDNIKGTAKSSKNPVYGRVVKLRGAGSSNDAADVIMTSVGGKPTGESGSFAGHDCAYWENKQIGTRACVTPWGGTLHLETKLGAVTVDRRAVEVRLDDGGPDSAFVR